jgi:predicted membrane channel-forming protein YqfA (hemolysin III family)
MSARWALSIAAVYILTGIISLLVVREVRPDFAGLAFMLAALVATYVGTMSAYSRVSGTQPHQVKTALSAILALVTVVFGLVVAATTDRVQTPEATVPLSVIGAAVCPFLFVGTIWHSMDKGKLTS